MDNPTQQTQNGSNTTTRPLLWCEGYETRPGTQLDSMGLHEAFGVAFTRSDGGEYTSIERQLTQDTIEDWIRTPHGSLCSNGSRVIGRILVGTQAGVGDRLRPPNDTTCIRFSSKHLSTHFCLPPPALSHASRFYRGYIEFPTCGEADVKTEVFSNSSLTLALSHDKSGHLYAAVIAFSRDWSQLTPHFLATLHRISSYAGGIAPLAYVVVDLNSFCANRSIGFHNRIINETRRALLNIAEKRDMNAFLAKAHDNAELVSWHRFDARNALTMARKWAKMAMAAADTSQGDTGCAPQPQRQDLWHSLEHCIAMLESHIQFLDTMVDTTRVQINTVLAILAYEQQNLNRKDQKISIAIAKASKAIAQETKKDGSSMKTLAVVAMLFLPATSVSSILAMPFFRWNEVGTRDIVNSKLWVYFAVAVPLTLSTIAVWWPWQRNMNLKTLDVGILDWIKKKSKISLRTSSVDSNKEAHIDSNDSMMKLSSLSGHRNPADYSIIPWMTAQRSSINHISLAQAGSILRNRDEKNVSLSAKSPV
jgi:hypothetical protein